LRFGAIVQLTFLLMPKACSAGNDLAKNGLHWLRHLTYRRPHKHMIYSFDPIKTNFGFRSRFAWQSSNLSNPRQD